MNGFNVEITNQIALVTIDRPKANAIDSVTSRALGEAFVGFENDPAVRVVIVTGAGERFFSAGWDLSAGEDYDVDNGVGGFGGFPDLPDRRKPVVAAVNGMAVGGGFEIAMAADLIVAAEHAQFFLPEASLGILPDAASVRLPRLLPAHIASELLLTRRRLPAQEAAHYGLVNRVVPAADLLVAARTLAAEIIGAAPLSIAAILDIGRRTANMAVSDAMKAIRTFESYRAAIDSDDAQEGSKSFTEKRPPIWTGR
ncbi:crotonobetainyl-CoA hydratase [soil metagenome]